MFHQLLLTRTRFHIRLIPVLLLVLLVGVAPIIVAQESTEEAPPIDITGDAQEAPTDNPTPEPPPSEPTPEPPNLEARAECTGDGIRFKITNHGGPMPESQTYRIDGNEAGSFQLQAGENKEIGAGYGQPAFESGDLRARVDAPCSPPEPQTEIPTEPPTEIPTEAPTEPPTELPTERPTEPPTEIPTELPTEPPTELPTEPSAEPTTQETPIIITEPPTEQPTIVETSAPTEVSTELPTEASPVPSEEIPAPTDTPEGVVPTETPVVEPSEPAEETLTATDTPNTETPTPDIEPTETPEVVETVETPTVEPPRLEVIAVCTSDGVLFTVTNHGGPMPEAQAYNLDGAPSGSFQLQTGESMSAASGYGQPTFQSGDLGAGVDQPCNPPTHLSGIVWNDTDGDGLRTDGEIGIPNATVRMISGDGFSLELTTDADGRYQVDITVLGDYHLVVIAETLPEPMQATFDSDGTPDGSTLVSITAGGVEANFGFTVAPATGSIAGRLWIDADSDGSASESEQGAIGVAVSLSGLNAAQPLMTLTGPDGSFLFDAVAAGDYTVSVGANNLGGDIVLASEGSQTVTLGAGEALTGIEFVFVQNAPAEATPEATAEEPSEDTPETAESTPEPQGNAVISGSFYTQFGNVEGPTLVLTASDGSVVASTQPDADGLFSFSGIATGDYRLSVDLETVVDGMEPQNDTDGGRDAAIAVSVGGDAPDVFFEFVVTL